MPMIEITDSDFSRLQKLATPFVDTPATTLARVLDYFESRTGQSLEKPVPKETSNITVYSEKNLPPLTHTKVRSAKFGDASPDKMTWDSLVRLALTEMVKSGSPVGDLYRIVGAHVEGGKKETDGYKYIPAQNFSYQGVSATDAVKIITKCAQFLAYSVRIEFEWRSKEAAYKPGERAILNLYA